MIALRVAFAIINSSTANQHQGALVEGRIEYPDVAVSPFAITVGNKVSLPGHLVLVKQTWLSKHVKKLVRSASTGTCLSWSVLTFRDFQ